MQKNIQRLRDGVGKITIDTQLIRKKAQGCKTLGGEEWATHRYRKRNKGETKRTDNNSSSDAGKRVRGKRLLRKKQQERERERKKKEKKKDDPF